VFHGIGQSFAGADKVANGADFWSMTSQGGAAHIFAHAMAGGILSVLQGGKFGNGFFSAGLSKAFDGQFNLPDEGAGNFIAETFANTLVGGTISRLTGGKFANGAYTAAFQHLFNEATSEKQIRNRAVAEELLQDKKMQKMLAIIREGEDADYDMAFNKKHISDLSVHPGKLPGNPVSAAGAYQFMKGTYEEMTELLGLTDFHAHSQDLAAAYKLKQLGAYPAIKAGNLQEVLSKRVTNTWTSLPGGKEQRVTMARATEMFN
jgi:muramidase (phage lysozyme)